MKAIGGYFSLELPFAQKSYIHEKGIHLNSGRNALEYILRSIPNIQCLWIPYYTCDVILEPLRKLEIPYRFYSINEQLELAENICLGKDEYLLATNYFGIKDAYMNVLASLYGEKLIIDNAQAFYAIPIDGIKTIYSPRKYVGIPDGGVVYMDKGMDTTDFDQDISYNRCSHLLKRLDLGAESGYNDFKENSRLLINQPIKRISNLTCSLLKNIDWEAVRNQRRENFRQLHKTLSVSNRLQIPEMDSFVCPMVYPFYTMDESLKKRLIANKIFVATYWPNVFEWCEKDMLEYELANKVIAIPIDQRYGKEDMEFIIKLIKNER